MAARITVVGSLNMDLVVRAPRIPRPGETMIGGEFRTVPGGKGANQAVAAARLGGQVSMIGRVGGDAFAQSLLDSLVADGVNHTFVTQDPEAATGVALIVVDDAGENSIVVASGANMRLSPADVDAAEAAIAAADVLLVQLEVPLAAVARAARVANAYGVTVILNPAPACPLPDELLHLVDVLVPNESETALLTRLPIGDRAEIEAAAMALRELGVDSRLRGDADGYHRRRRRLCWRICRGSGRGPVARRCGALGERRRRSRHDQVGRAALAACPTSGRGADSSGKHRIFGRR
jgi:ribokinase